MAKEAVRFRAHTQTDVYDVKFYPFKEATDDPVFAAVGKKDVSLTLITLWLALTNCIYS
jgi:hypothetical protein